MYPSEKAIARPEVKAFMDFVDRQPAGDRRGGEDRPADRRAGAPKAESRPPTLGGRRVAAWPSRAVRRHLRRQGVRASLVRTPTRALALRGRIKVALFAAAALSVVTTSRSCSRCCARRSPSSARSPIGDFLFGTKWTPQFARRAAVLRRAAAGLGHDLPTADRAGRGDPARPAVRRSTSPSTRRRACARSSSRCSRCWPACRRSSSASSR